MSFYEGRRRSAGYMDVHEPPGAVSGTTGAAERAPDAIDWLPQRKNRPVDRLLPITARWSDALPADLKPRALITLYPRIANLIALQWGEPGARNAYFVELLVDRRGNRQGFPPPVQAELTRLRDHAIFAR